MIPEELLPLNRRIQRIRDRVKSVACGYHTACYLVGRPGTSKTHTVMDELDRLEEHGTLHAYRNARMTPMGLFDFLEKAVVESLTKRERIELDRERVREAMHLFPGDTQGQITHSGLGKSTYYKRRAEIETEARSA